jgi:hydrogenase maturation protease
MADLIAVIGCGNPNRSDDGVGVEVARRLAPRARPDLEILDAGTDGMAVMFAARGCKTLVIVDACTTALTVPHRPTYTLHDFRWDHALHDGRKMYGAEFPTDVTVLLIEARSVALGVGLSAEVAAAADKTIVRIEQLLVERGACL